VEATVKRFACTGCGKCCNRSPEVELAEAAALADVFVFRLMFRLYWLPSQLKDFLTAGERRPNACAIFYGRKRLLGAFAARSWPVKVQRDGKRVEYTKYLSISALALDTSLGACSALSGTTCSIHPRRPLSCRSVPFHYSRTETAAEADLKAFVATPGYRCDTSESAKVVIKDGRIVCPEMNAARAQAIAVARADRSWTRAIMSRLTGGSASCPGLPAQQEIEANAEFAATTTSMRMAWQIAADVGLITPEECDRLIELQLQAIDAALIECSADADARETLIEMKSEYRHHLRSHRAG
jgi:Fe-S-cluster containining protein